METPSSPPGRRSSITAAVMAAAFLGIQVLASLTPSARNWGLHAWGFLPPALSIAGAFALGAVILLVVWKDPAPFFSRVADWSGAHPPSAFLLLSGTLAACALTARTAVPILGDGYTVLNNLRNTFEGVHQLSTSREPLGMGFFHAVGEGLRWATGFSATGAILAGELLLLLLFVACTAATARELFPGDGDGRRILTLLFALSTPYLQLFLGYAEVYAVTLAALSLTLFAVVRHLRGKLPFSLLPPLFVLQAGVHYLGMLLLPLLVYLGAREWKTAGWRSIAAGAAFTIPVVLPLFLWLGWARILPESPHSHFLPLSAITDSYTSYTLFSVTHVLEVANLLFLLGGASLLSIALTRGDPTEPAERPLTHSLILAAAPPLLFAFVAKFDLGMAKDWDVTASYFYPLALLGAFRLLRAGVHRIRAMTLIGAAALLSTAAFIGVNADREASLERVKTLTDPAVMSRGGFYQTTIHLSTAYLETREIDSMVVLWREFNRRYPDDLRGYQKLAKSLWEYGEAGYGGILQVYDAWLARSENDSSVRDQYARFCVLSGVASMKAGRAIEARERFSRAIGLEPGYAAPYYHTGVSFLREGKGDSALPWLERALAAQPADVPTLESIIGARTLMGDSTGALKAYEAAAAAGSRMAREYLDRRGGNR